jgi:DNA polymerase-3 subunit gamma/tau
LLGYSAQDFDREVMEALTASQIEKAIEMLLALYRNLRFSLNQRFELELVLTRFAQLDTLITPSEVRDALQEMKGQLLSVPGTKAAPQPSAAKGMDPLAALRKIVDALRREKPALASALEKVEAAAQDGEDLVLTFSARDRFQGDVVQKERDMVTTRLSPLLPGVSKLRLVYREAKAETAQVDQRVELVKKVFRGEIVKGEGHGDQSV